MPQSLKQQQLVLALMDFSLSQIDLPINLQLKTFFCNQLLLHQELIFSVHLFSKERSFYYQIRQPNPIIFYVELYPVLIKLFVDNHQASSLNQLINHEFFAFDLKALINVQLYPVCLFRILKLFLLLYNL